MWKSDATNLSEEFYLAITFLESRFFVVLFFAVQTRASHWNHLFACSNSSICAHGWLVCEACVDYMFQFVYIVVQERFR